MLVLEVSTLIVDWIDTETAAMLHTWFGLIGLPASVFFGARGNAVAAGHDPACGWQYADNRRDRLTASS